MAIEIVDLPIKNGGSFHSFVNVYQRVYMPYPSTNPFQCPPVSSIPSLFHGYVK